MSFSLFFGFLSRLEIVSFLTAFSSEVKSSAISRSKIVSIAFSPTVSVESRKIVLSIVDISGKTREEGAGVKFLKKFLKVSAGFSELLSVSSISKNFNIKS